MTRINCVPVRELSDKHLLAEYREITRVSKLSRTLTDYGQYTMGVGHVKFFYDKGAYLLRRTDRLYWECRRRGFQVARKYYDPHEDELHNDWAPDEQALDINRQRITDRILGSTRPHYITLRRHYGIDGII